MNIFRLLGDLSHIVAIMILLMKIYRTRSCSGLSGKSQALFAIVYTARYLDLFTSYISLYNSVLKVLFIATSYATLFLLFKKFKATYDSNHDTFPIIYLVGPCAVLSLFIYHQFTLIELLWTFSIYLESVAIMPQLFMITKTHEAEIITSHYLFALGMYRGFYILNWIYRYHYESVFDPITVVSGIVQTLLYIDFFYLYVTKVIKGRSFSLPA